MSGWVNPADAFVALYSQAEKAFWLDRATNPDEPFSVIGSSSKSFYALDNCLALIKAELEKIDPNAETQKLPFSFRPGLVGYLGYESLSGARENADAEFLLVDRALVFDHRERCIYFIAIDSTRSTFEDWHKAALLRLSLVGGDSAKYLTNSSAPKIRSVRSRHDGDTYLELINRAKEFIARGDVYQLCLTNQIEFDVAADPLATFLVLRQQNPAPYGAYLRFGDRHIVSASPEQFIRASSLGTLSTKPIKGTRPRSADPSEDQSIAKELAANEKERAENLMIVDLMRNDLLQVCESDSVRVDELFEVKSYATVHQLVSTISGRLRHGKTSLDAVAACFPAGSMTGAPKLRAIEILNELEAGPRGIYSGALGYFGFDGGIELGMTIRTLIFEGEKATLGVGGGITIDSDPISELAETMLKAQALINALGVVEWKI